MTPQNMFFQDYFDLGICPWIDKYKGRVPEKMTPQVFADMVIERGLEIRMVDHVGSMEYAVELPCYLIKDTAEDSDRPYIVLYPDSMRGVMLERGRSESLYEAVIMKLELLFVLLRPSKD